MTEPVDWGAYLADFHADRAGRFEEALERCAADGMTPYTWLIRPVAGRARRVLDLACGSGAAAARLRADEAGAGQPRSTVIGVDRSRAELAVARRRHDLPVVPADAGALPFCGESFDAVICSMGLMVAQPLEAVLAECARVLRVNGMLAATVASAVPLRASDLLQLGPLTARLRSAPRFPSGAELTGLGEAMAAAGLDVLEDARERFCFRVRTEADARLLIESLYLPETPPERVEAAIAWLGERAAGARDGVDIAVPVRRVLAMRSERTGERHPPGWELSRWNPAR